MSSPIDTISQMKRTNRSLWITVGVLSAFVVIDFFASLQIYSDSEASANSQAERINELYNQLEDNKIELDKYHVTEEYIVGLGATPDQARKIIKAGEAMHVSPKF